MTTLAAERLVREAESFGAGMSATEAQQASRRGMAALRQVMPDVLEKIARRMMLQAVIDALPDSWLRRAEQFEQVAAAYRAEGRRDGEARSLQVARACRTHAWLLDRYGPGDEFEAELAGDLDRVLGEAA